MRILLLFLSFFFCLHAVGANPPERDYRIAASAGVQQLDTLSIVANTFTIYGPDGELLDEAFYEMDFSKARISLRVPPYWEDDSLRLVYKVYPINFSAPLFVRDTSLIRPRGPGEDPVVIRLESAPKGPGLLSFEGLQSSGSITRGFSIGNRQDPVLNSAMNLQLNGLLTENITVMAVVSDQNIPFQPEGTTQQLQDFDKVFIRLDGYGASLTAGDFELERPPGHFLNLSRKARGGMITYDSAGADTTVLGKGHLRTTVAGAISRGKYARNRIQGQEGNQGPYRLQGNENESYILVLAGTEKVFIDGRPMMRGMDRDYIIDYNTAEITFMPSVMITRESRIIVEFEYAERNFVRSMVFAGAELEYDKASFRFHVFNEQDHPAQPLFQQISEERQALMAAIGDSIHKAFDWNVDSTGFSNDRVMYRLTDSLGFDTVFVYSTDPLQAVFQPGFSFVGQGQGNYRQVSSSANGRVFQWIAPVDNMPQGTHEPIIQLVTPKNHQMMTFGGDVNLSARSLISYEYALSRRDINLFSDQDKANDVGQAFFARYTNNSPVGATANNSWQFSLQAFYEFTDQHFLPLERYRSIEFARDWNIEPGLKPSAEHLPGFSLAAEKKDLARAVYSFQTYLRGDQYQGILNSAASSIRLGKNRLQYQGSMLSSRGLRKTAFYRHRASYLRDLNFIMAGVEHQTEDNKIFMPDSDSLTANSEYFSQWEFFLSQREQSVNQYRAFYQLRQDALPNDQHFETASKAHNYGLMYQYLANPNQRAGLQLIYRELDVVQKQMPGETSEQTINIRADYTSRWARGAITSALFYETMSGRERRREYIYLEVPAGQGAYVWNDYNANDIMELDEFEISPFPDEANFIRVFIPTDDFIPVYSTSISHSINLEPAVAWRNAHGFRKFIARFSNRLNYRLDNKKQGSADHFNPFLVDVDDSLLINLNSVVRNSLFFNRSHPRYNLEWIVQDNRNKNLLSNGFESRVIHSNAFRSRWNIQQVISLQALGEWGRKRNESQFFLRKNYTIHYYLLEPGINYQPARTLRFSLVYGYQQQNNTSGPETATTNRLTLENRISFPSRGNLQLRYQLSRIDFPFDPDTPLAFEILQGLREGINHVWNINWQHNINEYMQLSLQYNGRKPTGVSFIHTGSVSLRALF